MVAHTFNHSTLETEADLWVQGQHGLHSEFQASLHSKTPPQKLKRHFFILFGVVAAAAHVEVRRQPCGVAFSFLPSQGFLGSNSSQKAFVVPFSAVPPCLPLNLWNSLCVASFAEVSHTYSFLDMSKTIQVSSWLLWKKTWILFLWGLFLFVCVSLF